MYINADIALEIRHYTFRSTFSNEGKRSSDKIYSKTIKRIRQLRRKFIEGHMNDILKLMGKERRDVTRTKLIKVGVRGQKVTAEADCTGVELMKFLEVLWST